MSNTTTLPLSASDVVAQKPLTILFEDDFFVAVDKPRGLLVHRSDIDKHETQFLLQQLRDQIGTYVYPVHRLDKPTSGVIVFGKNPEVVAALKLQMEANEATKEYLLVCRGFCPEQGVIDHPLKPISDFKNKRAKGKPAEEKPAQEAITAYKRLAVVEIDAEIDRYPKSRFSLVKAQLLTGRKHQLRRHFKHLSHPIIGCPRYGKSKYNHYFARYFAAPRLLLHAYRLSFCHPISQQHIVITAAPSGSFASLLERFGWLSQVG